MESLLNSEGAQAGGWTTFTLAATTWLLEILTHVTINDIFQYILSAGGIIFIFYKIKSQRLDVKIKQQTLKEKQDRDADV